MKYIPASEVEKVRNFVINLSGPWIFRGEITLKLDALRDSAVELPEPIEQLRPCPFCGYKRIELWPMKRRRDGSDYLSPYCERCGATINENFGTEETTEAMTKAWNRRKEGA